MYILLSRIALVYGASLGCSVALHLLQYDDLDVENIYLDGAWTKALPESDMYIIVMEGVLEYFSKEQVRTCLNNRLAVFRW